MALRSILKTSKLSSLTARCLCTEPKKVETFRTLENDPTKHTQKHMAKFYSMPLKDMKHLLTDKAFYKNFRERMELFDDCSLMVRAPALEIKSFLEKTNFKNPPNNYVIYGERGTGKTVTLANIIHYCYKKNWLILHVPEVIQWYGSCKEVKLSEISKTSWDTPKESADFLSNFLRVNKELLQDLDFKTTKEYVWNPSEKTPTGTSLVELCRYGVNRTLYSSECVRALLNELVFHSASGKFKTLIAVDGWNYLYYDSYYKDSDRKLIKLHDLTFFKAFRDIVRDRKLQSSAVVMTVNSFHFDLSLKNWMPLELLTKPGFGDLDPYIGIHQEKYTGKEFGSQVDYLESKNWIKNKNALTEDGKKELEFLTVRNPHELSKISDYI